MLHAAKVHAYEALFKKESRKNLLICCLVFVLFVRITVFEKWCSNTDWDAIAKAGVCTHQIIDPSRALKAIQASEQFFSPGRAPVQNSDTDRQMFNM